MKTSRSPVTPEVTPSKKKLKQARLPFMLISETSPKPVTPPSRKRKLSSPDSESATKVGKICKENDIVEDPVIVIDDDSKDGKVSEKTEKMPNPYVKLVDAVLKKKMQKSKGSKKKKSNRKSSKVELVENGLLEADTSDDKTGNNCDMMEVDEPSNELTKETNGANEEATQKEIDNTVNECHNEVSDLVDLNNSKNTPDVTNSAVDAAQKGETSEDCDEEECDLENVQKPTKQLESIETESENVQIIKTDTEPENSKESLCSDSEKETPESAELKMPETPKRSSRNKSKKEENNNSKGSPANSKLNESMSSNLSTPKQSRSSSVTKLDESQNESTPNNVTPKQLQKKLESAKKREEREKEKQDREKKRQQEKEERVKQKQEKEEQKKREREEKEEAKKKEKEEKEELKKKEREEKEKQREEKEEQKRKEKEEKDEQKRKEKEAREDEKRKKQQALEQEKQEQEMKKKKTAEAFVSFFVPKQKAEKDQPIVGSVGNNMLSSFTLKSDMRLAPTTRTHLTEEKAEELVRLIKEQKVKEDGLYLKSLKNGVCKPLYSGKTWTVCDKDDDDVILVEDELPPIDGAGEIITCEPTAREKLRPKLLGFHENRRPPYWGTWRKKSQFIKPRRPFGQDQKQLDYEVDSDEEWEEEQEGESIDGSAAGSDDEQGPDEYEVDNEVFVPHGYLSDEEATMDEDDVLSLSPETQKAKLKHLEDEFESEMKKPTEKLKPRLYGLLWENSDGSKPEKCVDAMWNYFGKLAMILNDPTPLLQPSQEPEESEKKKVKKKKAATSEGEKSPKSEKKKKAKPQEKDPNQEVKKNNPEAKKNQPGINMFLTKVKST